MSNNKAYENIKRQIIRGRYAPGDPLNERTLMDEYKIGKTPLREILLRLQNEGLIRRFARLGTVVAPIDVKKLREGAELRHHIENIVARLAVRRISGSALEEMRAGLQKLEDAFTTGDVGRFEEEENRLHNLLYAAAGNAELKQLIENQFELFTRAWFALERAPVNLAEQLHDWQAICQALCEKDEEKAAASCMKHFATYFSHLTSMR